MGRASGGYRGEMVLQTNGVADGTRTHDNRNHNPGLYQLSYSHHGTCLALSKGPEPARLGNRRANVPFYPTFVAARA
jgi:hypothetical protein